MKPYQQTQARELYLQGGLTQQQIASLLDINRKTVGLWIQQGQWRQMRIAAQQTPAMLLQDFYNQLAVLNETIHQRGGIPTIEESIVQRRLIMNIQSFKQQPVSNYMQLYTELINEITKQDPELARKVTPIADAVVRQKTSKKRLYMAQDMFLTDEIEEAQETDNESLQHTDSGQCEENVTFCNISENPNTEAGCDIQPKEPEEKEQKNNPEECNKPQVYILPNGIIWLGDGYVYDPIIGKKREVTQYELTQFKDLNPPPDNLNTW